MWHNQQVSLYDTHNDKVGRPAVLWEIIKTWFGVPHNSRNDFDTILALRALNPDDPDYKNRKKALKDTLQGYTPAALLATREHGKVAVIKHTGIISIDFDQLDDYDLDEVKQAIGALPFVGYCGLSASGKGLFALVLIAEPERQREYAEHLFEVFKHYGLPPDTTKGRNVNDLRYVSYDSRPVINFNAEPLRVTFKPKPLKKQTVYKPVQWSRGGANPIVTNGIQKIAQAQVGQRWHTVQQVAFTFGGLGDPSLLSLIKDAIAGNPSFTGQEDHYRKCATDCFNAGMSKPLLKSA
jgi:VirE N-terminal domain.